MASDFIAGQKLTAADLNQRIIKAWARYDMTVVNSSNPVDLTGVLDSFNVSGVQDIGTGDSHLFFDTDFGNAGYSLIATCDHVSGVANISAMHLGNSNAGVSGARIIFVNHSPALVDVTACHIIAVGDQ